MTWRQVKDLRILQVGKICEVCGKRFDRKELCGHHVLGRKLMRKYNLLIVELCEIRCTKCEQKMHKTYFMGNPPRLASKIRMIINFYVPKETQKTKGA